MATHPAGDFPSPPVQCRQKRHRSESGAAARPDSSGRSASGKPENLCPDSETKPSAADSARLKNSDRHGQAETDRGRRDRRGQAGQAGQAGTGKDRRDTEAEAKQSARPDSSGRSASGKPENLCPDSETKPSAADSARIKNSDRHGQAETDRSRQGRQKQAGHRSGSTPAARPDSSGRSASSKPENLCPE